MPDANGLFSWDRAFLHGIDQMIDAGCPGNYEETEEDIDAVAHLKHLGMIEEITEGDWKGAWRRVAPTAKVG